MDEQGNEHVEEVALEPTTVVRSRRPRTLWAVLAAVGVAAGALVVTSAGDDGTQRPGLPVDLASRSGAESAASADASMLAWVTYVAGDDLPDLGGEATAYRLSGAVDEAQVRALADALGLDGDVESDGAASWWVEGDDDFLQVYAGGGAYWSYLQGDGNCVATKGGAECTFAETGTCVEGPGTVECETVASGGSGSSAGSAGCAESREEPCAEPTTTTYVDPDCSTDGSPTCTTAGECPPGADCAYECGDPAVDCQPAEPPVCSADGEGCVAPDPILPAADLPSEDEARRIALAIVDAAGTDVDDARVTIDGPFDAWYVTVEPVVDGAPSGLLASVAVGPDGKVLYGNGYLGQPEALGDYPLLDTRAVIDRANAQSSSGFDLIEPALGAPEAMSSSTGGDEPVTTIVMPVPDDPCVAPEGASDGCGGTTGGDPGIAGPSATTIPCKVQDDGSEICESVDACVEGDVQSSTTVPCDVPPCDAATTSGSSTTTTLPCIPLPCPPEIGDGEPQLGAPEIIGCVPQPDPEPIEITLVDVEPALVLLPATDGSADAYLVPAYRFTDADGGTVDLPAVADDALAGPSTTNSSASDPTEPPVTPTVATTQCEVLEEEDASGTTHTIQTDPGCIDPDPGDGEEPVIGVGYQVDVLGHCANIVDFDGRWWSTVEFQSAGLPIDTGTFTLTDADHGVLVGEGVEIEMVASGPTEDYPGCE